MPGVSSILDIGKLALFGNQAAIETTGSNIANVNTEGYARREVRFEEQYSLDYSPGQLGTGVIAAEVIRHFDEFVEAQYNDKAAFRERFDKLWENLKSVDSLVDESNTDGISAALVQFYEDWQDLSVMPDDFASRSALLSRTQNMIMLLQNTDADMVDLQLQAEEEIRREVDEVNSLLEQIAEVNRQIAVHDIPGENNANKLFDDRDLLVRRLAEKMDIVVIDKSSDSYPRNIAGIGGDFAVLTKAGHTLVDGTETFEIKYESGATVTRLDPASQFDGEIDFDGQADFEYTLEVVKNGNIASGGSALPTATFRVSLDGGRTWLLDEEGQERHFSAGDFDNRVTIGGVDIWFKDASQGLTVGDRFDIAPKNGLYWYENTSTKMNITSQIFQDGSDDPTRLTGGKLSGLLAFSGSYVGRYRDRLDAFARALIWEVNRLHSQGAGLSMIGDLEGTYAVRDKSIALGVDSAGLSFGDRLGDGNVMVYFYDADTDDLASNQSFGPLDFDSATAGIQNFDPEQHSLSDVAAAFNNTFGTFIDATIVNNRLHLKAENGYQFGFGSDTSGLLAALGVNTFFTGVGGTTMGINGELYVNVDRINAGHINGAGESNPGDNATALALAGLRDKEVAIPSGFDLSNTQTLNEYYSAMVALVGGDTANAEFSYQYNKALSDDLDERQQAVSGVNLDEEMSNLIKFQHAYRAAAKLITTADEMLQTVLGLKQ